MNSPYPSPTGSVAFEIETDDEPTDEQIVVAEIHDALTPLIRALVQLGPRERAYWAKQVARAVVPLVGRVAELVGGARPH
jgi:hypothetical protein